MRMRYRTAQDVCYAKKERIKVNPISNVRPVGPATACLINTDLPTSNFLPFSRPAVLSSCLIFHLPATLLTSLLTFLSTFLPTFRPTLLRTSVGHLPCQPSTQLHVCFCAGPWLRWCAAAMTAMLQQRRREIRCVQSCSDYTF